MPILIALRTNSQCNFFRDVVVDTLASGVAEQAVLCSGFFQENFKNSQYRASLEKGLATACAKSNVELVTIGVHNGTWKPSYINFQQNMKNAGVNIRCLYKSRLSWHAKIFIAFRSKRPILGVIGSSNITRNAFSIGGTFNNECDVYLLPPRSPVRHIVYAAEDRENGQKLIRSSYSPRENEGMTLADQIQELQDRIYSQELREL